MKAIILVSGVFLLGISTASGSPVFMNSNNLPLDVAISADRSAQSCPTDYQEFQGMCYRFVTLYHYITANNASTECRKISGGNLASSSSLQLNNFLYKLETNTTSGMPFTTFGLRCPKVTSPGSTAGCMWDDGTPFSYSNFMINHPMTGYSGCCDFRRGTWGDCYSCDLPKFSTYFCQAPKQ